jgi:hypothetical protein
MEAGTFQQLLVKKHALLQFASWHELHVTIVKTTVKTIVKPFQAAMEK